MIETYFQYFQFNNHSGDTNGIIHVWNRKTDEKLCLNRVAEIKKEIII